MHKLNGASLAELEKYSSYFHEIKRGLEKESLRIQPNGYLSQANHPAALGSTLTNSHITTDYSEALPEFITSASTDRLRPLEELKEIHQFVYRNIGDELLWVASMPCAMGDEKDIPIAKYGSSNSGQMKEIYRIGLGHRYGRLMQTIAGVHYNFSLPESFWKSYHKDKNSELDLQDFISEQYMGLIRNYLRFSWMIPLFFGASPAVCESFLKNSNADLNVLIKGTKYGRYATSLRMSDLGYQNKVQSRLNIGYNSLKEYIEGLENAISTPDTLYETIGLKQNGEYQQLSTNILQIENEFYSSIRPKRVSVLGERPSKSLKNYGVEYIEVRALDLNPFSSIGIEQFQISFLDVFLLACLFTESPPINLREAGEYQENFRSVVMNGRHPELCLMIENRCTPIKSITQELLNNLKPCAKILDKVYSTSEHQQVIEQLMSQTDDFESTFSGKIIDTIKQRGDGYFSCALDLSKQHKDSLLKKEMAEDILMKYQQEAADSLKSSEEIEQNDDVSFEEYLARYYE